VAQKICPYLKIYPLGTKSEVGWGQVSFNYGVIN
jgi:hypothetical protein